MKNDIDDRGSYKDTMRKTFKYRLYPNCGQKQKMENTLNSCRWVYNYFLEQRINLWEEEKSISCYEQINQLPFIKKKYVSLQDVNAQVLQNATIRLDLAYKAFFRRLKVKGEKAGFPRFKGKFRYDSFCYPNTGFKLSDNFIKLSKIGSVKVRKHRHIEGKIKTCTINKTKTGKWFACLSCEILNFNTKQPIKPIVGIDLGLKIFAVRSDECIINNPRFFRKEERALAKVQKKFSKQIKGSKEKQKTRKVVARVHERINNKRHNFSHQESRKLVNEFNTIVVEDLNIKGMQKNSFRGLNKSIQDAAWRKFLFQLDYKAEEAGKQVIKVNPAFTSQMCSKCGNVQKLKLSQRIYKCPKCCLTLDRDFNAAINILTLGTQSLQFGGSQAD